MDTQGVRAQGRKEQRKHLNGERLTYREAVLAYCYECMGRYADGKKSCEKPSCPFFPFMPYREVEKS